MTTTTDLPAHVRHALHTAVAELPADVHPNDVLDTMCQLVPIRDVDTHEAAILTELERIR